MQSKLEDLKLLIESNEKGKVAQFLVKEYEKRVVVTDSLLSLANSRINLLNNIINNQEIQIRSLNQIRLNDSVIIGNQGAIMRDKDIQIAALNKSLRRQKTKTTVISILGTAAVGLVSYLCLKP